MHKFENRNPLTFSPFNSQQCIKEELHSSQGNQNFRDFSIL